MTYTYWLVRQGNDARVYDWIHDNYPGINFWVDSVAVTSEMYAANMNKFATRFQNCTRASVFWFEDLNALDVNVKFKLMNADIILDHKHEKPDQVW